MTETHYNTNHNIFRNIFRNIFKNIFRDLKQIQNKNIKIYKYMGIINAILGNASEINSADLMNEYRELLCDGEQIEKAFKIIRDKWVFTNKRLIIQDIQGMTGNKRDYHSIPYASIAHFAVETAGTFDTDAEMKLWIRGMATPVVQNFGRNSDIKEIQRLLAKYIL